MTLVYEDVIFEELAFTSNANPARSVSVLQSPSVYLKNKKMPVYSSVRHRLPGTPINLGKKLDFSSTKFTLLKTEYYRQEYTKRGKKINKQTSTFTVKKF